MSFANRFGKANNPMTKISLSLAKALNFSLFFSGLRPIYSPLRWKLYLAEILMAVLLPVFLVLRGKGTQARARTVYV